MPVPGPDRIGPTRRAGGRRSRHRVRHRRHRDPGGRRPATGPGPHRLAAATGGGRRAARRRDERHHRRAGRRRSVRRLARWPSAAASSPRRSAAPESGHLHCGLPVGHAHHRHRQASAGRRRDHPADAERLVVRVRSDHDQPGRTGEERPRTPAREGAEHRQPCRFRHTAVTEVDARSFGEHAHGQPTTSEIAWTLPVD